MMRLNMNRKLLIIGAVISLVMIIVIGLSLRHAPSLRLFSTNPTDGGTPHQYTPVTFTFNQPLAATQSGINEITLTPSIAGRTIASDKTVTFTPNAPYSIGVKYKATLKGATNKQGEKLGDITISFTPKYVPYNELPENVQKALNADSADVHLPYSPAAIGIGGTPALTIHGVTDDQILILKTAFYQYFQSVKQETRGLNLTNVTKAPFNKFSTTNVDVFNFNVTIDNKTAFNAKLEIGLTTDRLYLYYPVSGKLIFDSGTLSPSQGN